MTKVNLDTIKPWVTRKITELLGFEDDVVIEFIFNQLDERVIYLTFLSKMYVIQSYAFDRSASRWTLGSK